ncbi:MAG: hypothetical protein Q9190_005943 [Brigantiaea leucoxantha]
MSNEIKIHFQNPEFTAPEIWAKAKEIRLGELGMVLPDRIVCSMFRIGLRGNMATRISILSIAARAEHRELTLEEMAYALHDHERRVIAGREDETKDRKTKVGGFGKQNRSRNSARRGS